MSEVAEYQEQLSTVNSALKDDPENQELLELQKELLELLAMLNPTQVSTRHEPAALAKQHIQSLPGSPQPRITTAFRVGSIVSCHNGKTKKWEEAKVLAVSGTYPYVLYTVRFTSTHSTASLNEEAVRAPAIEKTKPARKTPTHLPEPEDSVASDVLEKQKNKWQSFTKKTKTRTRNSDTGVRHHRIDKSVKPGAKRRPYFGDLPRQL